MILLMYEMEINKMKLYGNMKQNITQSVNSSVYSKHIKRTEMKEKVYKYVKNLLNLNK